MAVCASRGSRLFSRNGCQIMRWLGTAKENGINNCPVNCLCSNKIEVDYKNTRVLSQFVSEQTGRILPRTITGICLKKQRKIAAAIKLSRQAGFLPYLSKLPQYLSDPALFKRSF